MGVEGISRVHEANDIVPCRYLILDVLGQGTFGQVVKCQNMRTHEVVAVKVVKNKPAYLNQSLMEVAILQLVSRSLWKMMAAR